MEFHSPSPHRRQLPAANISLPASFSLGVVLFFTLVIVGCASLDRKFRGVTVADIGFFADETFAILSQADFAFTRDEAVYTRGFFSPEGAEEQQLQALIEQAEFLFDRIIAYSLELVEIYQAQSSDADRVAAYADSLETIDEEFLVSIKLTRPYFNELVAEIREQKHFIDALQVAQPILNGAGWYMNEILNELADVTDAITLRIHDQIDERYRSVVDYQQSLEGEKFAVLDGLELVYQAYSGDEEAVEQLRDSGVIRKQGLLPDGSPSNQDLVNLTQHLTARLEGLHEINHQIDPMWELYRASHLELDQLHARRIESINATRLLMMIWIGAHYHMATGHRAPAEWFDIAAFPGMAVDSLP